MKREDRTPTGPAHAERLHTHRQPLTTDDPVVMATTYSGIRATAEEVERQLLAPYGPDRLPGTESRRRSNMGLPTSKEERTCAQCREPLTWYPRFCSQSCWREWHESQPVPSSSPDLIEEMQAALDALTADLAERGLIEGAE